MKVSAIISAAFLGAVPLLALADASDDEHGFRIETTEQAAAAMSAPLFFNPMVPSVGEALPFFAAQSAEKLRSAAARTEAFSRSRRRRIPNGFCRRSTRDVALSTREQPR